MWTLRAGSATPNPPRIIGAGRWPVRAGRWRSSRSATGCGGVLIAAALHVMDGPSWSANPGIWTATSKSGRRNPRTDGNLLLAISRVDRPRLSWDGLCARRPVHSQPGKSHSVMEWNRPRWNKATSFPIRNGGAEGTSAAKALEVLKAELPRPRYQESLRCLACSRSRSYRGFGGPHRHCSCCVIPAAQCPWAPPCRQPPKGFLTKSRRRPVALARSVDWPLLFVAISAVDHLRDRRVGAKQVTDEFPIGKTRRPGPLPR